MTLYVVEHRLPRAAPADMEALHEALRETTRRLTEAARDGSGITYVRSTVIFEQHRCICVFEASSAELVRRANELAQVPIAGVCEAVDYAMEAPTGARAARPAARRR